jgi:GDP-mannose 6-dehydrogenase
MRVSIFGLGYVGCVSAACLAKEGHEVIGVDINTVKVGIINEGRSPIIEAKVEGLIGEAVNEKTLHATKDAAKAVRVSDISLVCVGTPGNHNGSLDLTYIQGACQQIGEALASKNRYHTVVMRSTMLPGTIDETVIPALEYYSGKRAGSDFGVAANPEFLREGTSVEDFYDPPFTLIGANDDETFNRVRRLYAHIEAPVISMGIREAEMVKYASNCFHALKITFANEIGNVCNSLGVDSHKVMEAVCSDTKLNLSPAYLKPGFAFGGSCLPKDLRAITYRAKQLDVDVPLLNSILVSNRQQLERAVDAVLQTGRKTVGVLGLSFKSGTDDLRESPMVALIETLIGKGLKLTIFDDDVSMARLFGANKRYIENEIPHISCLLRSDLSEVIEASEVIIVGKKERKFRALFEQIKSERLIIDLEGMFNAAHQRPGFQGGPAQ